MQSATLPGAPRPAATKHSTSIFAKLGLRPSEDDNRPVLAFLNS
jgi:hypothetical protein